MMTNDRFDNFCQHFLLFLPFAFLFQGFRTIKKSFNMHEQKGVSKRIIHANVCT